ncbi:DUF3147 family protein [Cytobacillus firmus]|uniref:DUF3147 family protein n=1 Tax=Cytobacillus firmus TaxID=1399 RepID=UPI0018CD0D5D|nr:membrane protein [Cytobacillus firmus]
MFILLKIVISAMVIASVTEIARRFPTYGGIIAALPIVSILSIVWLYLQGESFESLSKFTLGVLIGFPATAFLLFIIYIALKGSLPLFVTISIGVGSWTLFILLQNYISKLFQG